MNPRRLLTRVWNRLLHRRPARELEPTAEYLDLVAATIIMYLIFTKADRVITLIDALRDGDS